MVESRCLGTIIHARCCWDEQHFMDSPPSAPVSGAGEAFPVPSIGA